MRFAPPCQYCARSEMVRTNRATIKAKPKSKSRPVEASVKRKVVEERKKSEEEEEEEEEQMEEEEDEDEEDAMENGVVDEDEEEVDLDEDALRQQDENEEEEEDLEEEEEERRNGVDHDETLEEEEGEEGITEDDEDDDNDESERLESRDSPGFWAIQLEAGHEQTVWSVEGAAELNDTDAQHDPDYLEMSLEVAQVTMDHRTPEEVHTVMVSTRFDVETPPDEAEWFTLAFLTPERPSVTAPLQFTTVDRPVAFRLVKGHGPVTLCGRLVHHVNELPAVEAAELSEAVRMGGVEEHDEDEVVDLEDEEEVQSPVKKLKQQRQQEAAATAARVRPNKRRVGSPTAGTSAASNGTAGGTKAPPSKRPRGIRAQR